MTINGHVENGKIVLDEAVALTEGMKVRVEIVAPAGDSAANQRESVEEDDGPTLYERMKPLIGIIKDGPPDFARNHDHYIHGTPKK
jgi:hypothetical protein